jgi:signal transduction histidine kinase
MVDPAPATPTPAHWLRQAVHRPGVVDLGLWVMVSAPLVVNPNFGDHSDAVGGAAAMLFALALIVGRRRWPIPALVVGLVAAVVFTALLQRPSSLLPVLVVLLFNVAVKYDRRTAVRAGVAGVAAVVSCIAILLSNDFFGPELLAGLAWPTLAVVAGDAVRSRGEAIAAAEERAERAEATRDAAARQRVIEERLHIARELHDVIAHQIAVINVQAGVASHLLDDRPDGARKALAVVRQSAQQVLGELADILGVLRTPDDDGSGVDPVPALQDVPALVASFESVGLAVRYETVGETCPVSQSAEVAVYRMVQEALTNAHKHGDGSALLRIVHDPSALEVTVANRTRERQPDTDATGYGLVGMHERVHAAGGDLSFGREDDGRYVVRARFPAARATAPA